MFFDVRCKKGSCFFSDRVLGKYVIWSIYDAFTHLAQIIVSASRSDLGGVWDSLVYFCCFLLFTSNLKHLHTWSCSCIFDHAVQRKKYAFHNSCNTSNRNDKGELIIVLQCYENIVLDSVLIRHSVFPSPCNNPFPVIITHETGCDVTRWTNHVTQLLRCSTQQHGLVKMSSIPLYSWGPEIILFTRK